MAISASTAPTGADALAFVYILAGVNGHEVCACEGDLSAALAGHDAVLGKPAVLIWAEAMADIAAARALVPVIEALDDDRYAALLGGEVEVGGL